MKKNLLLSAALMAAMTVSAQAPKIAPVQIAEGFNQDVIAESTETDADGFLTSVTQDRNEAGNSEWSGIDGGGMVYYTSAALAEGAMCGNDGIFSTDNGTIQYSVNPAGLNALVLKTKSGVANPVSEGTLVFARPQLGRSIYIAGTSTDGDTNLHVTANYQDGTSSSQDITFYNWDSSQYASHAVVTGLGRMISEPGNWTGQAAGTTQGGNAFMIFQSSIDTELKPIVSVTISREPGNSCVAIFAVSMSSENVDDTAIMDVNAETKSDVYFDLAGRRLQNAQKGINIINGKKVVIK